MNLALGSFAFTYSFINMTKARSGEQYTSLSIIGDLNGELLRRTSTLGAKYCGLKDSCYVFIVNLGFVVQAAALALGLFTEMISFFLKLCNKHGRVHANRDRVNSATISTGACQLHKMTSFEEHCLGLPITRLFHDCNDFAVEAMLLTGFLFYGEHVYQATAVVLLLRTFNQLLICWNYDPDLGTLSNAMSCTLYSASAENYKLSEAMPLTL
ncbi:hypothetical protein PHMEG_00030968 [Phytophthora megakarya]|uniref:Uncharacterized protein n=1 Tax=Phytophthora megakarya TaxID=4795 RepID=A0A225V0E1_9STRA|nr:hypothetical protein PHMEG_00030968 [Phytophthora megakarya]